METISAMLAQLPALFHLSPLDWIVVATLITLSFASHILRLIRMLCEDVLSSRNGRVISASVGGMLVGTQRQALGQTSLRLFPAIPCDGHASAN